MALQTVTLQAATLQVVTMQIVTTQILPLQTRSGVGRQLVFALCYSPESTLSDSQPIYADDILARDHFQCGNAVSTFCCASGGTPWFVYSPSPLPTLICFDFVMGRNNTAEA